MGKKVTEKRVDFWKLLKPSNSYMGFMIVRPLNLDSEKKSAIAKASNVLI